MQIKVKKIKPSKYISLKLITVIVLIVCFSLVLASALLFGGDALAYSTLPSIPDENLYLDDISKFNLTAFDSLAKVVGYSSIEQMVSEYSAVKTASSFGTAVVGLGSFKNLSGVQQQLNWIPTYLSKDKNGNVILTLWLAKTDNPATTSYQETSWFSDGTYHLSNSKSYKETPSSTAQNIYSNSYDGSYVRHAMLLADDNYVEAWGYYWNGSGQTQISGSRVTMPDKADLNKFTMFTSGELANYIVAPENVTWQMNESAYPSDPSYVGKANYPNNWTKDKIWLPSASEVANGALWQTSRDQRNNIANTYVRSAGTSDRARAGVIYNSDDTMRYDFDVGDVKCAIRPALHLNLNLAIANGVRTLQIPKDTTVTYNGHEQGIESESWFDDDLSNSVTRCLL